MLWDGIPRADERRTSRSGRSSRSAAHTRPDLVLGLQRSVGNRATSEFLGSRAEVLQRRGPDLDAPPVPLPETTALPLTGGYEALEPGGNNRITMQFNQAGYHLEGWYQRRQSSTVGGRQRQTMSQYRIVADLVSDDAGSMVFQYRRYNSATSVTASTGTLRARAVAGGAPQLTMASGDWTMEFERTSTAARPPQEALESLPEGVRDIITAGVAAPLDRDELERLTHNLEVVKRRIRDYWGTSNAIAQMAPASQLNSTIGTIFGQFADQQKPLVRQLVMERLMLDSFTNSGNERTYWNWLQLLVIGQPDFTPQVQTLLGITADGGSDQLRVYRYAITLAGVSGDVLVGGGVMAGTFEIEYLGTGPGAAESTEPIWRRELPMGIVQLSGGASVGVTTGMATPWSTFETPYPWEPQNFNGPLLIGGVQASASAGPGGGGAAAMMTVYGDGSLPALGLPGASLMAEAGLHAGVEAGGTTGWIGGTAAPIRPALERPAPVVGESAFAVGDATHFDIDDPQLTEDGIGAVRRTAALQLATLESTATTLRIDGYASTTGGDEHNQRLSAARARNVLQAIKDVVPGFAVPAANTHCAGHGETAARDTGEPDQTENVAWRRVDIVIDGALVLSLH